MCRLCKSNGLLLFLTSKFRAKLRISASVIADEALRRLAAAAGERRTSRPRKTNPQKVCKENTGVDTVAATTLQ